MRQESAMFSLSTRGNCSCFRLLMQTSLTEHILMARSPGKIERMWRRSRGSPVPVHVREISSFLQVQTNSNIFNLTCQTVQLSIADPVQLLQIFYCKMRKKNYRDTMSMRLFSVYIITFYHMQTFFSSVLRKAKKTTFKTFSNHFEQGVLTIMN